MIVEGRNGGTHAYCKGTYAFDLNIHIHKNKVIL